MGEPVAEGESGRTAPGGVGALLPCHDGGIGWDDLRGDDPPGVDADTVAAPVPGDDEGAGSRPRREGAEGIGCAGPGLIGIVRRQAGAHAHPASDVGGGDADASDNHP